jgi:hypothetical protein
VASRPTSQSACNKRTHTTPRGGAGRGLNNPNVLLNVLEVDDKKVLA